MRTILLVLLFLAAGPNTLKAGKPPDRDPLSRIVNVSFRQSKLGDALNVLSTQGGFQWSYNAAIIDASRLVTLQGADITVREALYQLLGDNYTYKSNGNYIVIKKQKAPKDELSGYLRDPETGERIANATVYDKKTLRATKTDSSGYYNLKVKRHAEIVVSKLDYRDTVIVVTPQTPRYQSIQIAPVDAPVVAHEAPVAAVVVHEVERFFKATVDKWHNANVKQDSLHREFQISFLPKLGTNHTLSAQVTNNWSLNVLAGVSAGVNKLEVGGLGNFTREEVRGVQVGGLFNELRGENHGVQVGGLYNRAGTINNGVQVAGWVNLTKEGAPLSVQVAGLINNTPKGESMVQVSGLVNHADTITGVQVAGLVNNANFVEGVQVSGLVNNAGKVRGIQISFFNRAKELDGLQIGLLNR
ncbi:MAG: carboxypeptidase-like regulatory domain-containing protein, partial [Saprospiraceae bacterium]|nr:carboxypeptidase-like regulatory domain-containing protein [Saprospiraceae bacterium]